jgi:hypothetical protein
MRTTLRAGSCLTETETIALNIYHIIHLRGMAMAAKCGIAPKRGLKTLQNANADQGDHFQSIIILAD